MIIKITEGKKGLNLWVQEKPGDDQPPTHTASGRTREQILTLLGVILAEQDSKVIDLAAPADPKPLEVMRRLIAQSQALYAMLTTLDGWIQGAKENHEGMGHRSESTGSECWRTFDPMDIRRMVNDTCRELGISEFPITSPAVEG